MYMYIYRHIYIDICAYKHMGHGSWVILCRQTSNIL